MSDESGWARLAGDRPARTSSAALVLIWLAWVLVPAMLLFGAVFSGPFLGGEPTAADRSRTTTLLLIAAAVAVGLPLLGLVLTWRTRTVAAACFGAALVVVAFPVALLLADEAREADLSGPAPDTGPPVCQEHSGGDNRCPGG